MATTVFVMKLRPNFQIYSRCATSLGSKNTRVAVCAVSAAAVGSAAAVDTAAWCAEMTSGRLSVLPGSTPHVNWTRAASVHSRHYVHRAPSARCALRGVLRVTPPAAARAVTFLLTFEHASGFAFNIADSPTSNGYGTHPHGRVLRGNPSRAGFKTVGAPGQDI